jgi:hypothetical protein
MQKEQIVIRTKAIIEKKVGVRSKICHLRFISNAAQAVGQSHVSK